MTYDEDRNEGRYENPHLKFLTDEDPLERESAMLALRVQMYEASQEMERNPVPERREYIRSRVDALREALDENVPAHDIKRLEQQAVILDMAFRRLLGDADVTYEKLDHIECDPMKYAAAFKAQDQYRKTIKTLKVLKSKGKRKKSRGKRA